VLTRAPDFAAPGIEVVGSWEEALEAARADPELVVIGGAEVYRLAFPHADRIHLTRVHADVDGDTFFPEPDAGEWHEVHREEHPADARHAHAMSFIELARGTAKGPRENV
jgi:dihydrofolate reductase